MSTDMTLEILSTGSEHTEKIGESIGRSLRGGETIELISDVGGGKTTLMRGLARGAGSDEAVASPTFTISKLYKTPNFTINHLDLYRLGNEPGVIKQELEEVLGEKSDVVAIEWADSLTGILPEDRLKLRIDYQGEGTRLIRIEAPERLVYLTRELKK